MGTCLAIAKGLAFFCSRSVWLCLVRLCRAHHGLALHLQTKPTKVSTSVKLHSMLMPLPAALQ